jgi:ATP-dependent Clp protease protease subunit
MRRLPRISAKARPGALPVPADRSVSAFTQPSVLERWGEDAAGIRAVAIGDNVITMFDVIGEDFWSGGGITAKSVSAQLRAIGDRPVEVQINSPGGDMFEGFAIYNVLREHPQAITVKIMGMAASAASIVAMAGDQIEIGVSSFVMIHNCEVIAIGNRHDMQETAAWMEPFDAAMRDVYAARTGQKPDDVAKWMDAETYMSGSVAIERGFADALLPADQMTVDKNAKASDRKVNDLRAMEQTLLASGLSRSQARARINKIKGTPGAASEDGTLDSAVGTELVGDLAGLLSNLQDRKAA